MAEANLSKQKRLAFTATAAGASVLLSLLLLEAGSHFIENRREQTPQDREELALLVPNPLGTGSYRLKPNVDLVTHVGPRSVHIRTNSHGMPWREVGVEKKDRRRRIAFLGDSFTFGSWAGRYEKSFVGVFENNVSHERWEVLNFGVGGYGQADEELLLNEQVLRFSPTFVVVVIFTGNDFRDTFLGVDKETLIDGTAHLDDTRVRARVPPELLIEDDTVPQPCRPESGARPWLENLASFRLLSPWLGLENLCIDFAVNRNFTMYSFWSQYPYPDAALEAKDMVLNSLSRMDARLEERDARLAIVALPTKEQVHARAAVGADYDTAFPQAFLHVFARERNIPYIDMLPILRTHVQRTNERLFVAGDPHLNNRGHEIVGRELSDWFRCCVKNRR